MKKIELDRYLGFDTSPVQGFFRHETLFFWWGRTPSIVYWAASYFNNGLYAYGDREDQLLNRIERAVKLSEKKFEEPEIEKAVARTRKRSMKETGFKDHGQVVFYDFTERHGNFAEQQTAVSPSFIYRTPHSIVELLEKLNEFRIEVKKTYGPYSALRRKSLLMFILLDSRAISELKKDPAAIASLVELMENGHNQRIYPIIAVKEAADLSASLVKTADSALFIGDANEELALKFYKLPIFDKDYGAIKIGTSWDKSKPTILRRFAAVKLEKMDWLIERQEAIKQQDEDWLAYLEELEGERS